MLMLCSMIAIRIIAAESRVWCGDVHAEPWTSLGYSCPLTCYNVIYAIEKLRMIDYQNLITAGVTMKKDQINADDSIEDKIKLSSMSLHFNETDEKLDFTRNKAIYLRRSGHEGIGGLLDEFKTLLTKKPIKSYIHKFDPKSANSNCFRLLKRAVLKPHILNKLQAKCSRRSAVEEEFLTTLTIILNRHTKKYRFTNEMTKILLQKILGQRMDLRNGVFDIMKILNFLKRIIYERGSPSQMSLRLGSRHCLTTYVSGCFCKRGFVEKNGICVTAGNCTMDSTLKKYLPRLSIY